MFRGASSLCLLCVMAGAVSVGLAADAGAPSSRSEVRFQDMRIRESSGLARSLRHEDAVWTHNDSGGAARLFLVDLKTGETRLVCGLAVGKPRDWEDMASFMSGDRPMLVVGDVGSNRNDKRLRRLHFLDEPMIPPGKVGTRIEVPAWATIEFQFEDGYPDCEALGVDGATGTVWLVSKVRSGACGVYRLEIPKGAGVSRQTAERAATLELPMVTALDVRDDGRRMLLLTYVAVWEFRLPEGRTWAGVLKDRPDAILLPPLGRQIEAICYSARKNAYHLSAEGRGAAIWTRPLPEKTAPRKGGG